MKRAKVQWGLFFQKGGGQVPAFMEGISVYLGERGNSVASPVPRWCAPCCTDDGFHEVAFQEPPGLQWK